MTVYDVTISADAIGFVTVWARSEEDATRLAIGELQDEIDWQSFDNLEVQTIEGREDA